MKQGNQPFISETVNIDGKEVSTSIPQVKPGNDVKYWTEFFPNSVYKHKNDIIIELKDGELKGLKFHCQGDIKENPIAGRFPVCYCGNGKFKGEIYGSDVVGRDLIYVCKACGSKFRVWTE